MAKKRRTPAPLAQHAVTEERAARLCRLLKLLDLGNQTRAALIQRLKLDVRGFYRDLKTLRELGIKVELKARRYVLEGSVETALQQVPYPDPHLTVAEAIQLSKGRTKVHQKLKEQIHRILPRESGGR